MSDCINNMKQKITLTLCLQQHENLFRDAFGVVYANQGHRLVNCEDKGLTSYRVGKGVLCIDDSAFEDCDRLCEIDLPKTVKKIGDWAFSRCTALETLVVPASVTVLGDRAFNRCTSIRKIKLSGTVKSIGEYAFLSCDALGTIEIPRGTTSWYKSMLPSCYWSLLMEEVLA